MTAQQLHILVVDDEPVQRFIMEATLKRLGHKVDLATNGHEGIEKSRARKYDGILMDLTMPGCDGFKAAEEIRKFNEDVTIIAVTSFGDDDDMMLRIQCAGMNGLRLKPVRQRVLEELMKSFG